MKKKVCSICGIDISHKLSNSATKCEKCSRIPTDKMRETISKRSKSIRTIKNDILRAYNHSCAICGWKITDDNGEKCFQQAGCEIHHINPVSNGGKDVYENLILLCPNHHKQADYGIITKDVLKSYIIKEEDVINLTIKRLSKAVMLLNRQ